jgi:hypothetical protein
MAIGSNHGRELGLTNGHYPAQLALTRGRIHDIIWNFVDHFLLILMMMMMMMIYNAYVRIMACIAKTQLNLTKKMRVKCRIGAESLLSDNYVA